MGTNAAKATNDRRDKFDELGFDEADSGGGADATVNRCALRTHEVEDGRDFTSCRAVVVVKAAALDDGLHDIIVDA